MSHPVFLHRFAMLHEENGCKALCSSWAGNLMQRHGIRRILFPMACDADHDARTPTKTHPALDVSTGDCKVQVSMHRL